MFWVRLGRTVLIVAIFAALVKIVLHYGTAGKYLYFKQASRDSLSSSLDMLKQQLHKIPPRDKRVLMVKNNKRPNPDEYNKLLYGINITNLQERSYTQNAPFTYIQYYQNPCWLEHLTSAYMADYNSTPYHNDFGLEPIAKMVPIYDKRLKERTKPWRIRCLPYFFLLGVTKCGTTDFFDAILKHPLVHGLWVKEPMYWNRERYPGGAVIHGGSRMPHRELRQYVNMMDYPAHLINESYPEKHIIGDASSYAFYEDNGWINHPENVGLVEPKYTTPMALHTALPGAKLIILFRNPVNRLYSDYIMYTNNGRTRSPEHFDMLVKTALDMYRTCFDTNIERICLYNTSLSQQVFPITITASLYALYLREWFLAYHQKQFLIIKAEDYYENRTKALAHVFQFLGIRNVRDEISSRIVHQMTSFRQVYTDMWNSTRQLLDTFFEPFNKRLEDMLGRQFWN